jgi:hypothetical protein
LAEYPLLPRHKDKDKREGPSRDEHFPPTTILLTLERLTQPKGRPSLRKLTTKVVGGHLTESQVSLRDKGKREGLSQGELTPTTIQLTLERLIQPRERLRPKLLTSKVGGLSRAWAWDGP